MLDRIVFLKDIVYTRELVTSGVLRLSSPIMSGFSRTTIPLGLFHFRHSKMTSRQSGRAAPESYPQYLSKESWKSARTLVSARFEVLAIDFRGFGCSRGPGQAHFDNAPFENDVFAAVHYLKTHGVKTVSVVWGTFGEAAGDASIKSARSEIDRVVFLGAAPNLSAEKLKSGSLFIVARDDGNDAAQGRAFVSSTIKLLSRELIVLEGSPHAQFLFQTDQNTSRDPAVPLHPVIV